MKRCRLLAPLSLTLLLAPACDSAFEQTARPPQDRHDADATSPGRQFSADVSAPLLGSVTPAALFEHVNGRARRLAHAGYSPPQTSLPAALAHLDYEQYRSIRFRPEAALWRDETPFEVQFFHPGFLYTTPVRLHVVDDQAITPLPLRQETVPLRQLCRTGRRGSVAGPGLCRIPDTLPAQRCRYQG